MTLRNASVLSCTVRSSQVMEFPIVIVYLIIVLSITAKYLLLRSIYTQCTNLTNLLAPVTPKRRWGYSDRCVAHRLLSTAMRSNDDNDWRVNSRTLSLHDERGLSVRRLRSTVPCSMILAAYRDSRHGRTMTACDA